MYSLFYQYKYCLNLLYQYKSANTLICFPLGDATLAAGTQFTCFTNTKVQKLPQLLMLCVC
jgi:hypothetical protein